MPLLKGLVLLGLVWAALVIALGMSGCAAALPPSGLMRADEVQES